VKSIPFSGHYTADLRRPNNIHRLNIFRKFLGWETVPKDLRVLDIGASNFIGRGLGITDFTSGDLNRTMRTPRQEYDVVTCFEVVNHLMNHQTLLENIGGKLKAGGKLYLSTPKLWLIPWPHGRSNYVELKPRSIQAALEHFGFRVLRYEVHNPWPLRFVLYGFLAPLRILWATPEQQSNEDKRLRDVSFSWYLGTKPLLRWMFNRFQLYECERI
jgi:SAM-dependent methyltransferase